MASAPPGSPGGPVPPPPGAPGGTTPPQTGFGHGASGPSPEEAGRRGLGQAVSDIAADVSSLLQALLALARAELQTGLKAKGVGIGLLLGTAVLMWLAVQGLLIAAGAALALVMPVWAAALVVSGVLILIGLILALVARGKLRTPVAVDETKAQVDETVSVVKERLGRA